MVDLVAIEFPLELPPEGIRDLVAIDGSTGAPWPERRMWDFYEDHGAFDEINGEIAGRVGPLCPGSRPDWARRDGVWLEMELRPNPWLPPVAIWPVTVASLAEARVALNISMLQDPDGVGPDYPAETGFFTRLGGSETGSPQGLPAIWPHGLAMTVVAGRTERGLIEKAATPGFVVTDAEFDAVEVPAGEDFSATAVALLSSWEIGENATGANALLVYVPSNLPDFRIQVEVLESLASRGMALCFEVTPGGDHERYVRDFNASVGLL